MEPSVAEGLGFAHFLTQTDGVGRAVLAILLMLSLASWYLILTRALANSIVQKRTDAFIKGFWQASSLAEVESALRRHPDDNAFATMVKKSLETRAHGGHENLASAGGMTEYLTRVCLLYTSPSPRD